MCMCSGVSRVVSDAASLSLQHAPLLLGGHVVLLRCESQGLCVQVFRNFMRCQSLGNFSFHSISPGNCRYFATLPLKGGRYLILLK